MKKISISLNEEQIATIAATLITNLEQLEDAIKCTTDNDFKKFCEERKREKEEIVEIMKKNLK